MKDKAYANGAASHLETIGLILGPYRNLTTLTASALSLHPTCQVLNHAGGRLLGAKHDFLDKFSEERLSSFCNAALQASTGGQRRGYGGSILLSHAFDRGDLRSLYETRYGSSSMKPVPTCLVWKESQLVTNRIRTTQTWALNHLERVPRLQHLPRSRSRLITSQVRDSPEKIVGLLEAAPRLRYLMPVRNPLDCAMSNVRTGHARWIPEADPCDPRSVLVRIVETLAWFAHLASSRPDRFYMFFEDDSPDTICSGLGQLLELEDDQEWRAAVRTVFDVGGKRYEHDPEMHRVFEESLDRFTSDQPELADRLTRIVVRP